MRSVLEGGFTRRVGSFGAAALLGALLAASASAQSPQERQPLRWDGEFDRPSPNDLTQAVVSQFELFGNADLAWLGNRARGTMLHTIANNGPMDYYGVVGSIFGESAAEAGYSQMMFMGPFIAGLPPSEWQKHRQAVPSLNNASGGGYVANWNLNAWFLRYPDVWMATDDQLGTVHSGAASTSDGACTDFQDDNVGTGVPLMAASDCELTWGSEQFAGASKLIPFTGWVNYFNDVGGANFSWDWWRVPPEYVSEDLIGDFQSYGKLSDWTVDGLSQFGNVVPGGAGSPTRDGYPLGLTHVFDFYNFSNPDVSNVTYWRSMIINNSEQVYGVPLDYDSLYFGNQHGFLMSAQRSASYYRPELGGVYTTNNGVNPTCNDARDPPGVGGCIAGTTADAGFGRGANAILVLNSPIGDLRNKLFSDPNSPFYFPGHPNAGDTITFTRGGRCGYGGCWANTTARSTRSGYGYLAADVQATLDGRSEADFGASDSQWWLTFRNYDFPTKTAQYNRYIPPGWNSSYTPHPDTLFVDSCLGVEFGGAGTGGCSELWSDTLPGRLNNRYGNFGGVIGVGPVPLAAGDTTRWTLAMVTGPTQATIEANARNAINLYLNSYLKPDAAPAPNIVSVATTPGDRGRDPGASAQLFWDDAPEQWTDLFLLLAATALENTDPLLVAANPWLPDSMRTVATNNVNRLMVFKTCDFGTSYTDDGNCNGDPATNDDGSPSGTGWLPYATFFPDEDGRFPNAFLDQATTPGKTYVYSLVTVTNGFTAELVVPDPGGGAPVAEQRTYAPVLYSVLTASTSAPFVASVYIPASRMTGGEAASFEFTVDDPRNPVDYYEVDVLITSDIEDSSEYDILFGDSTVVTSILDLAAGTALSSTVSMYRTLPTSTDGGTTITRTAYDSTVITTDNSNGIPVAGGATTQTLDTLVTVYADELTLLVVSSGGVPMFTSSVLDGSNTTPGTFFGRTDFPNWLLNVNNGNAGLWASTTWFQVVSPDSTAELRSAGTTAQPTGTWLRELVTPTGASYNQYTFTWTDKEWGPGENGTGLFTLNLRDPEQTNDEFNASLDARVEATTTSTSQEVADALGVAVEDLLTVTMPFTVTHQDPERDVTVAMLAADKLDQILLGTDVDAIFVDVPEDKWVPGDEFILLETVSQFQEATGPGGTYVVTDGSGAPVVVDTFLATWNPGVFGCVDRSTCNPLQRGTRGAPNSTHLPVRDDQYMEVRYLDTLTPATAYGFETIPTVFGADVTEVTQDDLNEIRVVPNPYVVFSDYEQANANRRLMFIGLPPNGTISIYSVAGQFVQRISYDESMLDGNGDLYWDMRTRENTELASGLYLFYVDGTTGDNLAVKKLGKFVVIR
ncbi:MAG: hypothetical protein AMS21_08065 [Gemmatimonas sp. SG8_38_2]|nr:MAG: hypothetical protein AMS21_08065 [Gemmatimonas sp. SG8_38_2]